MNSKVDNSSNFYLNDRKFLGAAEIINILDGDKDHLATQKDVKEMSFALRWIGMDLKLPHLNLTDHQLKSTIDEILKRDRPLKDYNMFVLVVIAHGCKGDIIISSDGKESVTVSELVNKLDSLEDLKGRPKVLIVESCRGGNENTGFEVTFHTMKDATSQGIKKTLPTHSDIIVAYSTVPDQVSWTIAFEGSPFLITLATKLKELAETQHLGDILTRVRNEISEREFDGKKQLTQVTTTLRKDINLFVSDKKYFKEGTHWFKKGIYYHNFQDGASPVKYRYYGDLLNGEKEGRGMTIYEDGTFYSGNYKNDLLHGKGFWCRSDGYCYEGDCENGRRNGKGVQIFNFREKARYEGEFKASEYNGIGILYNNDEQKEYEGEFKDNKKYGTGILYNDDGQKDYEGEFKDSEKHGNGILYFPNGDIYIGGFEDGKRKGFGNLLSKDHKVLEAGLWENNELKRKVSF